jgi:hypothetical protein
VGFIEANGLVKAVTLEGVINHYVLILAVGFS